MPAMTGAVYRSEIDDTSYWAAPVPAIPTSGEFGFVWVVEVNNLYSVVANDHTTFGSNTSQAGFITLGKNVATFGAFGECFLRINALNGTTPGTFDTPRLAVNSSNASTGTLDSLSKTAVQPGDRLVVALQRNATSGKNELRVWNSRTNAVTLEWSITSTSGWGMAATTWRLGDGNWASTLQAFGLASRAFTDADLAAIGGGADIDTIVPSGSRLALWCFDTLAASIPSQWGTAGAATRQGTWTNPGKVVGAPLPTSSTAQITITEPLSFGFISMNDDGTAPTYTWSGTYTGFVPTAMQARVLDYTGTVVKDWTDLGSFSAASGTWSGTLVVPVGSLFFIEVRDKTTTSITRRGVHGWRCGAVIVAMGQSPHVIFSDDLRQQASPSGCPHSMVIPGVKQILNVTAAGWHAGRGLTAAINEWAARTNGAIPGGVPIMTVHTAVVGSSASNWAVKTGTQWVQFLAALDFAKPQRVLLSWLNGASGGSVVATEKASHQTIINNLGTDLASRGIAWRYRILPHNRDAGNTSGNGAVRRAQVEIFMDQQDPVKFHIGPWWADMQFDVEGSGTVAAATSTTMTLDPNDPTYVTLTRTVEIVSGTGAGQVRTISSVVNATRVATISAAWDTIPDTTSVYRTYGNGAHPNRTGLDNFGPRYGLDTAHRYGYTPLHGRGPRITNATRPAGGDGSIIDVRVQHTNQGNVLRTPSGTTTKIPGFTVYSVTSGGVATAQAIASVTITDQSTVRLVLAAAPPSADISRLVVRYGEKEPVLTADWDKSNNFGIADLLYDNSGVAPKGGLPLYFTLNDVPVVEENPALSAAQSNAFMALA